LDEARSKHIDLAPQNGFRPAFFGQFAEVGKKAQKKT
jgi:hypothetical protein